ncbi:MAG: hypothetical protein AB1611_13715 [bacterium]
MKITSYNITDVSYHYIGLRVLAGLSSTARREEQTSAISRNVLKYVSDKALRLMLPEPKGTFETIGEKVCQELVHFQFARSIKGSYQLTDTGKHVLSLLNEGNYVELRRTMVTAHLQVYDNLRSIVQKYLDIGCIWLPIVEAGHLSMDGYIQWLLEPTFNGEASTLASAVLKNIQGKSPKKVEDALREIILRKVFSDISISVPLFHALCDRLVSLRLLNVMRANIQGREFAKSYSPCVAASPPHEWYIPLNVSLASGGTFMLYFCEPNMADKATQAELVSALDKAFSELPSKAGYYDLPEVRDFVCAHLRIPDAAFDEGINYLLDQKPSVLTVGLHYEGISGRRKPLSRSRETSQLYNLVRRV